MLARKFSRRNVLQIITARKRTLGQGNMFTGVYLSTGGAWCWGGVPGSRGGGWCAWSEWGWSQGSLVWEGCLVQRSLVPGGLCAWSVGVWSQGVPGGEPPPTATAAGGTHPTGMHSCWTFIHGKRCITSSNGLLLSKIIKT